MTELGWKSVGVLELTALPSIDKERWVSWVREADALLVNGGDARRGHLRRTLEAVQPCGVNSGFGSSTRTCADDERA
jgi:hypothetical protein